MYMYVHESHVICTLHVHMMVTDMLSYILLHLCYIKSVFKIIVGLAITSTSASTSAVHTCKLLELCKHISEPQGTTKWFIKYVSHFMNNYCM